MSNMPDSKLPDPHHDPETLEGMPDMTVELSFDDQGELDLQALADEAAAQTPDRGGKSDVPTDVNELIQKELENSLEEARKRIVELEKHEQEYLDKHHRLLADFSNYRNRTSREIQMAVELEVRKVLLEVLPVLDNFDRSMDSEYPSMEAFRGGVALIQKQFQDVLRKIGAEPVELAVGDPFDAQFAEALTTMTNPTLPDGSVAAVYEKGYRFQGQLLRAARVVVNHNEEGAGHPAAQQS